MSKILPILFNTDMVRAILDGRKTVTRRIIKLPHCGYFEYEPPRVVPQYQVGDTLYVRETQSIHRVNDKGRRYVCVHYKSDDSAQDFTVSEAEWQRLSKYDYTDEVFISPYWTTKETARIWLKVTAVRAERLQDVTEEQAKAEGFADREHFVDTFLKLYPDCSLSTWVWVYEFERCERPEEGGE